MAAGFVSAGVLAAAALTVHLLAVGLLTDAAPVDHLLAVGLLTVGALTVHHLAVSLLLQLVGAILMVNKHDMGSERDIFFEDYYTEVCVGLGLSPSPEPPAWAHGCSYTGAWPCGAWACGAWGCLGADAWARVHCVASA